MAGKNLILIIEDNEDFQNLYGLMAKDAGFEVEGIYNGQDALQRLDHAPIPTLLLLDSRLPGVHGDEILQAVRASENWSHVPVYIITADLRGAQKYREYSPDAPHADGVIEKGADSFHQLRELFAKYRQ